MLLLEGAQQKTLKLSIYSVENREGMGTENRKRMVKDSERKMRQKM